MSTNCEKCGQQTEYNGWKNYETWAVALWIDNDEGTYNQRREMAREAIADATPNVLMPSMDTARWDYEQSLKQWIRDEIETLDNGLASDLLGSALDNVDWREIASNWIEEERENMPKEAPEMPCQDCGIPIPDPGEDNTDPAGVLCDSCYSKAYPEASK